MRAAHWREMAEEMRANGETMRDNEAKQSMLKIAAGYERMARRADAMSAELKEFSRVQLFKPERKSPAE